MKLIVLLMKLIVHQGNYCPKGYVGRGMVVIGSTCPRSSFSKDTCPGGSNFPRRS